MAQMLLVSGHATRVMALTERQRGRGRTPGSTWCRWLSPRVRASIGGVLVLACTAAVSAANSSSVAASAGPCRPAGSRTIVQNAKARVYRTPAPKTVRGFVVSACAFSLGVPFSDDGDFVFTFLSPALSLRGATVGLAFDVCDVDGCRTTVGVWDLSKPENDLRFGLGGADAGPGQTPTAEETATTRWAACATAPTERSRGSNAPKPALDTTSSRPGGVRTASGPAASTACTSLTRERASAKCWTAATTSIRRRCGCRARRSAGGRASTRATRR